MSDYTPPIEDMVFTLKTLGFEDDDMGMIFEEAAKLASGKIADTNRVGDASKITVKDGVVTLPAEIKDAYNEYRDGGWNTVPFPEEFGGMDLPWAAAFPIQEMWQSANMAFGLCPLLNQGAVDAILHHGTDEQKAFYLPKLISGEWTGTMNLTEPHAGSDLGLLKTKAIPQDNGTYKISGQKIWITYGEHDLAENIIHLVLARTSDEDVKGISLFIVPKFLEDGTRNDVKCIGVEHKLGIHGSPTCTMQFGDEGGATGYLVADIGRGLFAMFTMMNNARLSVGLQGVAIGERAYQTALEYANDRVQGRDFETRERVVIAGHPDVKRMLLTMKALNEAGRALTYEAAVALNEEGEAAKGKVELLTPIVKGFCTENSQEVTSLGVQIHGGNGYMEEYKAAQYMRDARILAIYEGTNGIQAIDLIGRKLGKDGALAFAYIEEMKAKLPHGYDKISDQIEALEDSTKHLLTLDEEHRQYAALAYLIQFGTVAGAVHMARQLSAIKTHENPNFSMEKENTAAFYLDFILPRALSYAAQVKAVKSDTTL